MSDPTARRGDIATRLLNSMIHSERGWTKNQIRRFIFDAYRYGVRDQTIDALIDQLKAHGHLYAKAKRKGSSIYLWYANPESNIECKKENKKE